MLANTIRFLHGLLLVEGLSLALALANCFNTNLCLPIEFIAIQVIELKV